MLTLPLSQPPSKSTQLAAGGLENLSASNNSARQQRSLEKQTDEVPMFMIGLTQSGKIQ
jgi:hypothetical protein